MNRIKQIFLNEVFILNLILFNALLIFFIQGFNVTENLKYYIAHLDHAFTILFVIELIIKVKHYSLSTYVESRWNIFDGFLILLAIPSLFVWFLGADADFDYILVLRVTRIFKFFRFIKFFPNINILIERIQRALRASVIVLIGFLIYNFIVAILSCFFYRQLAPEYFGNPLTSFYTIFRIFTVEGWYEIPDIISARSSNAISFLTKLYFTVILLTGGIFGLSLVNSIFVDAMVSDNNDALEKKVNELQKKIDLLLERGKKE
jgi:voltage-gated sodium channel